VSWRDDASARSRANSAWRSASTCAVPPRLSRRRKEWHREGTHRTGQKSLNPESTIQGREVGEPSGFTVGGSCLGPATTEPETTKEIGTLQSFVIEPPDQEPREVLPRDVSPSVLKSLAESLVPRRSHTDLERTLDGLRLQARLSRLGVRCVPPRLPRNRRDRAAIQRAADRDPRLRAAVDAALHAERRAAVQDDLRIW
jgi:hypothetical protein